MSVYAFASTEAYQLLKLPAFVTHFIQHTEDDPQLSLLEFIKMHYAEAQQFDADWMQDMQLPFKSCESAMGLVSVSYYPLASHWTFVESATPVDEPVHLPSYRNDFIPGLYTAEIFQPPRA